MMQAEASDSLLRREIGKIGVGTIAMNGVIGSGIFALPAVAIAQTGYFSPWVFILCGLLILSVALTLARTAGFFDITGGPVAYTTHRSEEHTSEFQSLMRTSYAVFCLKKKNQQPPT